jgi:tetratricopeptide (TPR) repeat protein
MSTTLNLVDQLLLRGRRYQDLGRTHDARVVFGRLLGLYELPAAVAAETQARLAELELHRHKYQRARRHLTAALAYQPANAHYHHLMANALEDDDKGDPERALEHYRQSLQADPEHAGCLSDFGLLALSLGQTAEGMAALRRAAELAPDDPRILANLVEGLSDTDQAEEAHRLLLAARFRNPHDDRFLDLWNDFQFQQLHAEQEAQRQTAATADEDEPMLLPFVRRAEGTPLPPARKRIRHDPPAPIAPPHLPRRLSSKRHA